MAFSLDFSGDEQYEVFFRDLHTGEILNETIRNISCSFEWANDDRTVFYNVMDESHRPFKIMKYQLRGDEDTAVTREVQVYEETDRKFEVTLYKTNDEKYIIIESDSSLTSEIRYIDANQAYSTVLFATRELGVKYRVEHDRNRMFIVSNYEGCTNFRILYTTVDRTEKCFWKELLPYDPNRYIQHVIPYEKVLVSCERVNGFQQIRILPWRLSELDSEGLPVESSEKDLEFPHNVYAFSVDSEQVYSENRLRLTYSSLATPDIVYEYDLVSHEWNKIKEMPVLGGFDKTRYSTNRIFAIAPDNTRIPISLVYRNDVQPNGSNPTLLYGYGSYGISMDPSFESTRVSYLDRGLIFAIAHIRGGGDNGRLWYEDGKLLRKKNSFTDFIACAEKLIADGYTNPEKLAIEGRSAGGLLVGATLNLRPELFKAALGMFISIGLVRTGLLDNPLI